MPKPVITGLSTREVLSEGGDTVVVTGRNFTGATRVFFDDVYHKEYNAKFTVNSDYQITLISPELHRRNDHHIYVEVGGQLSTTPSERTMVSDGDGMSATGTGGITLTTQPNDANRIRVVSTRSKDLFGEFMDHHSEGPDRRDQDRRAELSDAESDQEAVDPEDISDRL
ncbi:IPT/TIG domain-containing protein [Nocardia barduliensis]|uniref:IPT/TIG domain-containing protein n=1 Tax=Nocardia barduliensis TaxID=2736643 RepID=UPI0015743C4B|nr:IPT/TIG domain-containing protein [Nocardia barduliensis]